jgi:hypothetical protein
MRRTQMDSSRVTAGQPFDSRPVPIHAPGVQQLQSDQRMDGERANRTSTLWQSRLTRLYLRLALLEQLLVSLLRALHLWPALLQPPQLDPKQLQQSSALLQSQRSPEAVQPADAANSPTSLLGWASSSLRKVAETHWPSQHWQPLSFRKQTVVEPAMEPAFPEKSTRHQDVACCILISGIWLLNTLWMTQSATAS